MTPNPVLVLRYCDEVDTLVQMIRNAVTDAIPPDPCDERPLPFEGALDDDESQRRPRAEAPDVP